MKDLWKRLNQEIANFGVLYIKLHSFHWNVKGITFHQLHELFARLYEEAALHLDILAKRVLMLEGRPVATIKEFMTITTLSEAKGNEVIMEMINQIIYDYITLDTEFTEMIKLARSLSDEVTVAILVGIQTTLQKNLWTLKAMEL
jgi:starvation-inducible DNA-binding protein